MFRLHLTVASHSPSQCLTTKKVPPSGTLLVVQILWPGVVVAAGRRELYACVTFYLIHQQYKSDNYDNALLFLILVIIDIIIVQQQQ